jgi:octaprenyl-diphosphate synthase
MTLPLIYALSKASWSEKRKFINIVKTDSEKPRKVKEVIQFVKQSGGLEYAITSMNKYHQEALRLLDDFPDTSYKQSLIKLVQFTIERNN